MSLSCSPATQPRVLGVNGHSFSPCPLCHCGLGWVKDILGLADTDLATKFYPKFYVALV